MEFVNTPGPNRPRAPQAVVLLDPITGLPLATLPVTLSADSTGAAIAPEGWTHAYAYDASGLIVTDTATDGTGTWVKTYTYNAAAQLTGETNWVKQ